MAIVRFEVHVHWVPEMGSMDVTASEQPYYWYFDPQEPAFKKMYGILWSSLCEHVSEEAIITDVKINGFNTIETHPAAFLQQGDVVHVYVYHSPEGYPPTGMGKEKIWPWLTEFCPLMSMWQAEADTEQSALPATTVGQILLTMAKFC